MVKIRDNLLSFDEDVFFRHIYFPNSISKMFNRGGEEVDHLQLLENYVLQYQNQG